MRLLMISGDRSILQGKRGAFWYTLHELRKHFDRIDIICPHVAQITPLPVDGNGAKPEGGEVHFHPSPRGLWYQPRWILTCGTSLIAQHHIDVMTVHEYPPFYNGCG